MAMTTVQAEASQCLFEFLHMEIVTRLQEKEEKVVWVGGGDSGERVMYFFML